MTDRQAVVFILLKDNQVLMEEREMLNGLEWVYPGGLVEEGEQLEQTLKREVLEECGVIIKKYHLLSLDRPQYSDSGVLLHAYLVNQWDGEVSEKVLDQGNNLKWISLQSALKSKRSTVVNFSQALLKKSDLPKEDSQFLTTI